MRRTALALAAAALLGGCGGGGSKEKPATTATTAKPAKKPSGPKYVPSGHHSHRPAGFVYNDEIGENVQTATYDRIIELFGPPASRHGKCIRYKVVGQPHRTWEFCFKGQRMTGAAET